MARYIENKCLVSDGYSGWRNLWGLLGWRCKKCRKNNVTEGPYTNIYCNVCDAIYVRSPFGLRFIEFKMKEKYHG